MVSRGNYPFSIVIDSPIWRDFLENVISKLPNLVTHFIAGRLRDHVNEWRKITRDKQIIDTICGLKIEFTDLPFQNYTPNEYKHTKEEIEFLNKEIEKLLTKRIIVEVEPVPGQYVSNIFLRDKKDGSYRMILNLKKLNYSVEYYHFKMETLKSAINLMTPGCYMASMDFKDAYYSVPIFEQHRKYLRFTFGGRLFEFTCLPNGLSSGPRLFTRVTKPLFAGLRENGYLNTVYIDDSLLFGDTESECRLNVIETVTLAVKLGFVVHPVKSIFDPTQIIEFLGFVLNSIEMTVKLTDEKADTLRELCIRLKTYKKPKIRTVATVVGKMVAAFPGVEYGQLFYRLLDNEKTEALKQNKGNYEAKMKLSVEAKHDLDWWIDHIQTEYRLISHGQPQWTMYSDASRRGWGGIFGEKKTGGHWSPLEQKLHINVLELFAVYYTLSSLCGHLRNTHLRLMIDNQTAVIYMNKMGGKKTLCNKISRKILDWCKERNIWVSAEYITTHDNFEADEQSRIEHSNSEWEITETVFNAMTELWGSPEVDLFASRLNNKVDRYYSWKPDPFSIGVDAFNAFWGNSFAYVFPPFSLVGKILQKIEEDEATVMMVVPLWTTQSWFSKLLRMLIDCPFYFHRATEAMTHPEKDVKQLPKMDLLACCLSGKHSLTKTYQDVLRRSSCRHGDRAQVFSTMSTLRNGLNLQLRGVQIPLHPL